MVIRLPGVAHRQRTRAIPSFSSAEADEKLGMAQSCCQAGFLTALSNPCRPAAYLRRPALLWQSRSQMLIGWLSPGRLRRPGVFWNMCWQRPSGASVILFLAAAVHAVAVSKNFENMEIFAHGKVVAACVDAQFMRFSLPARQPDLVMKAGNVPVCHSGFTNFFAM